MSSKDKGKEKIICDKCGGQGLIGWWEGSPCPIWWIEEKCPKCRGRGWYPMGEKENNKLNQKND